MKKILYTLLLLLLASSCRNDEIGDSRVQLDNIYSITDDPNDPVRHRIYEIYEKYGVPVYFNDTIGQVLVTTDVNGQPYYRYETLDLGWDFDSYNKATYQFDYITDPDRQYQMLDAVEYYLDHASRALWPHTFFITDGITTISKDGKNTVSKIDKDYSLNFRVIALIPKNWEDDSHTVMDNLKREYVTEKMSFYKTDIDEFASISSDYYDGMFDVLHEKIGTKIEEPFGNTYGPFAMVINGVDLAALLGEEIGYVWNESTASMDEITVTRVPTLNTLIRSVYGQPMSTVERNPYTKEEIEILTPLAHYAIGVFGFVYGNPYYPGLRAPENAEKDLASYLNLVLNQNPDDFREEWKNCPLVLDKYEILYRVITDKLGVEL